MAENVENAKDPEDAPGAGVEPPSDKSSSSKKSESDSNNANGEAIEEKVVNGGVEAETCDTEKTKEGPQEDGGEDVVTLDDEGAVPVKTIPDSVFFENVSNEEKQYYEDNPISPDKIELLKVQCTACFKQVQLNRINTCLQGTIHKS